MFGLLFQSKKSTKNTFNTTTNTLTTDIHSHILHGLDDGAKTLEESIALSKEMQQRGYKKLICTPHIMKGYYNNEPENIKKTAQILQKALQQNQIDLSIDIAAEYYLDEFMFQKLEKGEELLSFGNQYLLFETSFISQPAFLWEAIFLMQSLGYKPILAHPERYLYLQENFAIVEKLLQHQVFLQLNINSIAGYYGREEEKLAKKLIEQKFITWAGSDCHGKRYIKALTEAQKTKTYQQLTELPLLNYQL
ncbi:MAG: capsular biosynthesis protein [Cytophagales bacterium]|nr:MAG: capsular biosynthesis protein [Cytophagales bacterium]